MQRTSICDNVVKLEMMLPIYKTKHLPKLFLQTQFNSIKHDLLLINIKQVVIKLDVKQFCPFENRRNTDPWLGVDSLGLNIYEQENRLIPKVQLSME